MAAPITPEEIRKKRRADYMREYMRAHPEKAEAARVRSNEYYHANKDQARQNKNQWRKDNPEANRLARARHRQTDYKFGERPAGRISIMVTDAKGRAKRKGLAFDQAILAKFRTNPPVACECCSVTLDYALRRQGGKPGSSPSLDRFNNLKGYTLENTVVICWRCNNLKGDASLDEMEKVVAYMRSRG